MTLKEAAKIVAQDLIEKLDAYHLWKDKVYIEELKALKVVYGKTWVDEKRNGE